MTATETALRADSLVKLYGARRARQGVSFDAAAGELVAVIGPNGAGKTTLLQILAGALETTAGTVSLDRREVGWVPQQPAIYSKLSVIENLSLFARLEKVADVGATVERMLDQTGLRDRAGDPVGTPTGCWSSRTVNSCSPARLRSSNRRLVSMRRSTSKAPSCASYGSAATSA